MIGSMPDEIFSQMPQSEDTNYDYVLDRLDEAIEAIIEAGQASTSFLQRKLKLSYRAAAKLIDTMEEMGIISAFEGSKPRKVIMTQNEYYKIYKPDKYEEEQPAIISKNENSPRQRSIRPAVRQTTDNQ